MAITPLMPLLPRRQLLMPLRLRHTLMLPMRFAAAVTVAYAAIDMIRYAGY